MTISKPPAIATWMLQHFVSGTDSEHIAGDLIEAYQRDHSRLRYWKETITAIAVSLFDESWAHPILAVRAIALGWVLAFGFMSLLMSPPVSYFIASHVRLSGYPFGPSMLIGFGLVLCSLVLTGWIVARLHTTTVPSAVSLYAASVFVFQFRKTPLVWHQLENALTNSRFVPYFIFGLELQFLPTLAILLGGMLRLRQTKETRRILV